MRRRVVDTLGVLATPGPALAGLRRWSEKAYRRSHDLDPVREHLARLRPRALWSTTCTSPLEYPYFLAARDLGIPVIASILSFDNLTSRSAIPAYDHYLVWSDSMKRQLRAFYPEATDDRVSVTGTAQFDFHRQGSRWPRPEALRRLGLPDGSRFFLYAASHVSLAPEEPALVGQLAARLARDPELGRFRLLLRLHPQDEGSRWRSIVSGQPNLTVSVACDAAPDRDEWKLPRPEEQDRLIASLAHAEACLNVASTMSLDAAALDRPAIGLDFSTETSAPRGIMYSEYGATHYEPLVRSGGVEVAHGWEDLLQLMRLAVTDPGRRRRERAAMLAEVCGTTDGRAAERIAEAVGRFLSRVEGGRA